MNNSNADKFLFGQLNSNYLNPYDWIELENVKSSYALTNEGTNQFPFRAGGNNLTEEEQAENDNNIEIIDSVYSSINQYLKVFDQKVLKTDRPSDGMEHKTLSGMMDNFRGNIDQLLRLLKGNRYPLLALIGRRGCGKSSCINAIVGQLIAEPGHIKAQTGHAKILLYRGHDGSGIDVLDTRGINEGERPQEDDVAATAVESIVNALSQVPVDCILYLHKAKELDSGIESDLQILNEIIVKTNLTSIKIPIIGVITHCDELEPSDLKKPCDYDEEKLENILKAQALLKKQLLKYAPDIEGCLIGVETVSSAIIWNKEPNEDGDILPKRDYRYNIDKIIDLLINNLQLKAMFKVAQICNVQEIKVKFANELVEIISSFVTIISSVPNRYSQDLPLNDLRVWMIYTIARLNNSTVTYETVYEFLNMFGFIKLSGYAIYHVVGTLTKVIPGFGNRVSLRSKKALSLALGKSAIAYFLENKSQAMAIEIFNTTRSELEKTITEESLQQHQEMINSLNHM